jgi:xylose isomerase
MLYWLDRVGYKGYLSLDQYPYREEPEQATAESIAWLQALRRVVERMGSDQITEVIRRGDATEAQRLVRTAMLG